MLANGREAGARGAARHRRIGVGSGKCYEAIMSAQKSLFDSPEAEAKSEARAEADVEAGRLISHAAVRRWLGSWGSAKRLPRPRIGD